MIRLRDATKHYSVVIFLEYSCQRTRTRSKNVCSLSSCLTERSLGIAPGNPGVIPGRWRRTDAVAAPSPASAQEQRKCQHQDKFIVFMQNSPRLMID